MIRTQSRSLYHRATTGTSIRSDQNPCVPHPIPSSRILRLRNFLLLPRKPLASATAPAPLPTSPVSQSPFHRAYSLYDLVAAAPAIPHLLTPSLAPFPTNLLQLCPAARKPSARWITPASVYLHTNNEKQTPPPRGHEGRVRRRAGTALWAQGRLSGLEQMEMSLDSAPVGNGSGGVRFMEEGKDCDHGCRG